MGTIAPLWRAFQRAHQCVSHRKRLRDLTALAYEGDLDEINRLLRRGVNLSEDGYYALGAAAASGHRQVAEVLAARCGDTLALQEAARRANKYGERELAAFLESRVPKPPRR
jgi:hypothetical protein